MKTKPKYFAVALLMWASAVFLFPSSVQACRAPRPSPKALVSAADFIVRAVATKYVKAPKGNVRQLSEPGDAEIEFKIEETLKGEVEFQTITLNGYLTDRDDFNDQLAPYDFVRPGGRGGSCSAYEYKEGATFLLFLKRLDGKLTVRWYALAPTNEQLHPDNDAWLAWVREQLKSAPRNESNPGAPSMFMSLLTLRLYPDSAIQPISAWSRLGMSSLPC